MCDHVIYVVFAVLGLTSPCVMVSISIHAPENNILSSYGLGGEREIHIHVQAVFHEPSVGLLSIPISPVITVFQEFCSNIDASLMF